MEGNLKIILERVEELLHSKGRIAPKDLETISKLLSSLSTQKTTNITYNSILKKTASEHSRVNLL